MIPPIAQFFPVLDTGTPPTRAGRSAGGSLPVRAHRYCEAVTSASMFGWHLYPPISFSLMTTDGHNVLWSFDEYNWHQLTDAVQYPDALSSFDSAAPEDCAGHCPPWMAPTSLSATIQIWSGLLVKTKPVWSLLIRAPVNTTHNPAIHVYEGIIETDQWAGPIFSNFRLTQPNIVVRFPAHKPFLQIQPIPRWLCGDLLNNFTTQSLADFDWNQYRKTVVENAKRPIGSYAVDVRKRRAKERTALCTPVD